LDLRLAAELACLVEVTARKPGNVHPLAGRPNLDWLRFAGSAAAIGPVVARAPSVGVGRTVLEAVRGTRAVAGTNTNLGILLLLTPLAAADVDDSPEERSDGWSRLAAWRTRLKRVLEELTVADAADVYSAIRLAEPGGMGKASEQDLAEVPTVTLRQAMILAADRDSIARQYANGFEDVFEFGVPALVRELDVGRRLGDAVVANFLAWLAHLPDSLIARKFGRDRAERVTSEARELLDRLASPVGTDDSTEFGAAGPSNPDSLADHPLVAAFDGGLRMTAPPINPGTTADLVTATLFAALRTGLLRSTHPW
jgi:triphosphoribosyl-dephospho-CoA synthase